MRLYTRSTEHSAGSWCVPYIVLYLFMTVASGWEEAEQGTLCGENSKFAREVELNMAGMEDREELFQSLLGMVKVL